MVLIKTEAFGEMKLKFCKYFFFKSINSTYTFT